MNRLDICAKFAVKGVQIVFKTSGECQVWGIGTPFAGQAALGGVARQSDTNRATLRLPERILRDAGEGNVAVSDPPRHERKEFSEEETLFTLNIISCRRLHCNTLAER